MHFSGMSSGNFLVIKSSAGSGKTYALVKHYLILALQDPKDEARYRKILAITFTNAAASEMRERVLSRMKEFSSSTSVSNGNKALLQEICVALNIQPDELHARASRMYAHMLHNYALISISTIDSFTHRLIRTFARDLRLNADFNVELEGSAFLETVVDAFINKVGEEKGATEYLKQFVLDNFEEGANWNVRDSVVKFSKNLLNEDTIEALKVLSQFSLDELLELRKKLQAELQKAFSEISNFAQNILDALHGISIGAEHLYYKGTGSFTWWTGIAKGKLELPGKRFNDMLELDSWAHKSIQGSALEASLLALQPQLHTWSLAIVESLSGEKNRHLNCLDGLLKQFYEMGILHELALLSKEIKEEQNKILISDFQEIIHEVVENSSAPFIYERVGERYQHILFDEFQDTSGLQWSNFIPLLENALASGYFNLIVGDGKQAIYRWRNGKVEQFSNLPEVKSSIRGVGNLFKAAFEEQILDTNYRSARAIIQFNNKLFNDLAEQLSTELKGIYRSLDQKESRSQEGYVQIDEVVNEADETEALNEWAYQSVLKAKDDGYSLSDIAILTRRGQKEIGVLSQYLTHRGIDVVTESSFLLRNSKEVQLAMAYLGYLSDSSSAFSSVEVIKCVAKLNPSLDLTSIMATYSSVEKRKTRIDVAAFVRDYYPNLATLEPNECSVYRLLEETVASFGLHLNEYLEVLFEKILDVSVSKGMSLPEVIAWWDAHKDTLSISGGKGVDAIQMMTIHKSKGLQFPVVIYPRYAVKDGQADIWVDLDPTIYGLPKGRMRVKGAGKEGYPPEFAAEFDQAALDDLNMLYVALTRPEDQLYIGLENKTMNGEWSKILLRYFADQGLSSANSICYGSREKKATASSLNSPQKVNLMEASLSAKSHFQLRTKTSNEQRVKAAEGEFVHGCLSEVISESEVDASIERWHSKFSFISEERKMELRQTVLNVLTSPIYAGWLKEGKEILSEIPLMDNTGRKVRPDKVIDLRSHLLVVDYKTGDAQEKYADQVRAYMQVIGEITNRRIEGVILYTHNLEIVYVTSNGGQQALFD